MNSRSPVRTFLTVFVVVPVAIAFVAGCRAGDGNVTVAPEMQQRVDVMRAKGTHASLTIFPVVMAGDASTDVADVVALMLEKAGMSQLATADAGPEFSTSVPIERAAALCGAFVHDHPIATEYALHAEFVGTPETGPQEIRCIIVDRAGQPVWVDRQTPADRAFRRAKPHCPMTCCQFLTERVRNLLQIPRSARDESGTGRYARKLDANSPGPGETERAAIDSRLGVMKRAGRRATLAVYPVRLSNDEVGIRDATYIAQSLADAKLCDASAEALAVHVTIQPSHNEQEWLWALADAFRSHVRQHPPGSDYAMLADYIMHPGGQRAWAVHFVVCDRAGDWVIVDFQNEHHGDFQRVDPKSFDDCGRLVVERLKSYLR